MNAASDSLTPKQRAFCAALSEGFDVAAAYLRAYAPANPKRAAALGARLRENPKVGAFLARADEERESRAIMRRDRRLKRLWDIAENPESSPRDAIAAIKAINEMAGDAAPKKARADGEGGLLGVLRTLRENADRAGGGRP